MSKRGKLVVKRSPLVLVVRGNIDDDMPLPAPCTMRARFQAGPASPGGGWGTAPLVARPIPESPGRRGAAGPMERSRFGRRSRPRCWRLLDSDRPGPRGVPQSGVRSPARNYCISAVYCQPVVRHLVDRPAPCVLVCIRLVLRSVASHSCASDVSAGGGPASTQDEGSVGFGGGGCSGEGLPIKITRGGGR